MLKAAELDVALRDRAVYLPTADALIAADLHFGNVAASPIDAPLKCGADIVARLGALADKFQPAEVVLAGDVLHSFGFVPRRARKALHSLLDRLTESGTTVVLIEGNHDGLLTEVIDRRTSESHTLADGTVVCHGHQVPAATGRRYVVGHDHPAIEIQGRRRPCFLYAPKIHDGSDVLGLPAFNQSVRGTVVNGLDDGDPLSPFLGELSSFQPIVRDEEAEESLVFPPLGALRSHL